MRARRAALVASAFALGMIATIALVGVATAAAKRMEGDLERGTSYAVAAVLILVGLHLLDALPLPQLGAARGCCAPSPASRHRGRALPALHRP